MKNKIYDYKKIREYCDKIEEFHIYDYLYFIGITNVKDDLNDKEILDLMEIISSVCGDYTDPITVAQDLTSSVYVDNYVTLEQLKKIPAEEIINMYYDGKIYRLEGYVKDQEEEIEK